jgi:hypothetical protein
MSASATTSTFEWTLERFPDLRLASAIVESPRTVLATLFGVSANDLSTDIPDVATYDTVFDTAQQWVVSIEKALIAAASEAVHTVVERIEATQRLHELALYDAQLVVLHLAGELLYHAYCRNDPKSATPERENAGEVLDVIARRTRSARMRAAEKVDIHPEPRPRGRAFGYCRRPTRVGS